MSADWNTELSEVTALPVAEQGTRLVAVGRSILDGAANGLSAEASQRWVEHALRVLDTAGGSGRTRLALGELLGAFGDPRVLRPADAGYWVTVQSDTGVVCMGRFPVTNAEYQDWVDRGGYEDEAAWSEDGLNWLATIDDPWPVRAKTDGSAPFIVPNQPVVGVSWWEADAYARAHEARLPRADERVWVTRGREKRPYPWGSPFGEGNANTQEEVLGRPCAVGLYLRDRTPEGVCDLAGNAGEWTADGVGRDRLMHPGSWDQPSLAAWAKAFSLEDPNARWAGLGFRLARDV